MARYGFRNFHGAGTLKYAGLEPGAILVGGASRYDAPRPGHHRFSILLALEEKRKLSA